MFWAFYNLGIFFSGITQILSPHMGPTIYWAIDSGPLGGRGVGVYVNRVKTLMLSVKENIHQLSLPCKSESVKHLRFPLQLRGVVW